MPPIPEPGSAVVEGDQAEADRERNQSEQAQAEIRDKVEAELQTMQPWINDQSRIAYDRIRRLLEHLEDAGFLFKSALRRYLKVCSSIIGTTIPCMLLHRPTGPIIPQANLSYGAYCC